MRREAEKAQTPAENKLLRDFLGHLSNERRLSKNTVLNYERDLVAPIAALVKQVRAETIAECAKVCRTLDIGECPEALEYCAYAIESLT